MTEDTPPGRCAARKTNRGDKTRGGRLAPEPFADESSSPRRVKVLGARGTSTRHRQRHLTRFSRQRAPSGSAGGTKQQYELPSLFTVIVIAVHANARFPVDAYSSHPPFFFSSPHKIIFRYSFVVTRSVFRDTHQGCLDPHGRRYVFLFPRSWP